MRRGPGLPQIPNYLPPGGSLPLSCSFGSEAPGGHGNMGPASRVPMTTGSPSGGAGAHQSVQVAPFGRGARREVGGRGGGCRGVASPLPISSSRGRRSARPVPFAYLRVTARARPPRTTGSPLRGGAALLLVFPDPSLLPGPARRTSRAPGMSPQIPSVWRRVPGNAGQPPSPAPARVDGIVRRRPPGACSLSSGLPPPPPGTDGDRSLAASPSRDTSPRLLGCP